MNPKYPIYIVSKGRHDTRLTARTLEEMHVPYFIVVEEQEYEKYCSVIAKEKVLILDKKYQDEYDTFDDLGNTKSKGPGAARNFAWDHSISNGHDWHWVMDDNIRYFYRLNRNTKIPLGDGTGLRIMEEFVERYTNVAMAGPNYTAFAARKYKYPPFIINTRIYSCNLIRNDLPFRWRGRYNEDTDISLRMLKAGWCTVQFYAFLQNKARTQTIKGGNTAEFYAKEGTEPKSKMLVKMHPDVSRMSFRYGRIHHYVDYRPFKKNKLVRKKDIEVQPGVNNFGLGLIKLSGDSR